MQNLILSETITAMKVELMFYFSINENALAAIKREAKSSDKEIIGVLIGTISDNLLVVNQAVSGVQDSGMIRVKLDNVTLAKIIDRIMKGELQGNIIGWYHSHPGFGVFMSPTDIGTQEILQQFSSKIAALVIDPKEDKFNVFTLDSKASVVHIPDEQIYQFKDSEDGIPPQLRDYHRFEAKLEIQPLSSTDRIRYLIQGTAAYWPEKKCLVCGGELKFDEEDKKWYCPLIETVQLEETKKIGEAEEESKDTKVKKAPHRCKKCEVDLKYSKKLGAWYCRKCRRIYKQRVKQKDESKKKESDPGESKNTEEGKGGVIVEGVEQINAEADKSLEVKEVKVNEGKRKTIKAKRKLITKKKNK